MTRLNELEIAPVYNEGKDTQRFYNDTLSVATSYKRVSAYFNNGIFKYISKGVSGLLYNGGKMQLLLSSEVDSKTYKEIEEGYRLKNSKENVSINLFENVFNLRDTEMSTIAFLIATDTLEIRMAFRKKGIFHDKFGLIEDKERNIVLFSGSNNETEAAVEYNYESFETTLNWNSPSKNELNKILIRETSFNSMWNNNTPGLLVLPIPEIIAQNLLKVSSIKAAQEKFKLSDYIFIDYDGMSFTVSSSDNIDAILSDFNFKTFARFFESEDVFTIISNQKLEVTTMIRIQTSLENISKKLGFSLIFSKRFRDYLDINFLDMDEMSRMGKKIKNISQIEADQHYLAFADQLNTLLKRPLRPAQLRSAYHITKLNRSMNFSVPGSGKTASVLGAFQSLANDSLNCESKIKRLLVIGPINCFKSWKDEYFTVVNVPNSERDTSVLDIKSADSIASKSTMLKYDFEKAQLILINFEIVNPLQDILKVLVDSSTMVVYDEIHRIKKEESLKFQACREITENVKYRVALTGTPLPNGYQDLNNIFQLIYGPYTRSYFKTSIDDLKNADRKFDSLGIDYSTLSNMMFPFYIRVNKQELGVPPANSDHLIPVRVTKKEREKYEEIISTSSNLFESIVRLVKFGCIQKPSLSLSNNDCKEFNGESQYDYPQHSGVEPKRTSKISALLDALKSNRTPAIIWCVFIETIDALHSILTSEGYIVRKIYGSTPIGERNEIIDTFNSSSKIDIIITNPHTLAESVSLHKRCHDAYYVEMSYALSHYLQSKDRIHRLGLSENTATNYYHIINQYTDEIENSIDYQIYHKLKKKEERMLNSIEQGKFFVFEKDNYEDFKETIHIMKEETH